MQEQFVPTGEWLVRVEPEFHAVCKMLNIDKRMHSMFTADGCVYYVTFGEWTIRIPYNSRGRLLPSRSDLLTKDELEEIVKIWRIEMESDPVF